MVGGFLMSSQEYLCKDTKGTLDDYKLYVHRSYFENQIDENPSKVETLEWSEIFVMRILKRYGLVRDCRGEDGENQTLIFSKKV